MTGSLTEPAKCAALEQLLVPPREMAETTLVDVLEKLLVYALQRPFAQSAVYAMTAIFDDYPGPREGVHSFMRAHGDALPEAIRRAYLSQMPKATFLTKLPPLDWQADPPPKSSVFDDQLAVWNQMWRDGIGGAVEYQKERRRVAKTYWEKVKK